MGADFLREHALLVDVKHQCLVDALSFSSIPRGLDTVCPPNLNCIYTIHNSYARLLALFSQITSPRFSQDSMKLGIEHYILTSGPSIHATARRLSPAKLEQAKEEKMLRKCYSWVSLSVLLAHGRVICNGTLTPRKLERNQINLAHCCLFVVSHGKRPEKQLIITNLLSKIECEHKQL